MTTKKKREPVPVSIVDKVKSFPYFKSALFKIQQYLMVAAILLGIVLYLALKDH
jgi:hypothetical protein